MSCVYDSLIQHTQLNGNLTIVTVFKHVHDLKLKPSKTTVHSSVSLSHTHTHTLTLEQETNLFVNQPLTQMFFFFFFFTPQKSTSYVSITQANKLQKTTSKWWMLTSRLDTTGSQKFTKIRLLADVSFPPYSTCSRTQIQTQDTANTHIYK